MKDIEKLLNIIVNQKYGFGTGVWPVVSPYLEMELNTHGEYITKLTDEGRKHSFTDEEIELLKESSLVFSNKDETDISNKLYSDIKDIKFNSRIGYYLNLYAGHVLEGNYRKNASSGGLGTWVLKELLHKKKIDYVIHVKESKTPGILFEYGISSTIEEVSEGAKTRYYPVELSKVLKIVKETPGNYALIGLPAYIMNIRLLSLIDPVINDRIKYTVGLVCGHQKSTLFGEFLAWQCGIKPGGLININFRKKLDNIPSHSYAIEVEGVSAKTGEKIKKVKMMKELVGADWGQGLFKVRASDFTDDVMNETADITLGDAWLPEYTQDSQGNNIVIVRNPEINELILSGIKEGRLKMDTVNEKIIIDSQLSHFKHTQDELSYRLFKKNRVKEWRPKLRVHPSNKISYSRRKIQDIRELICLNAPEEYNKAVLNDSIEDFINYLEPISRKYKKIYMLERVKGKIIKVLKLKVEN